MASDIIIDIENKALVGSGFTITGINEIKIHINKFNPLRGSSYRPLPLWIANKKACINIKNKDAQCFKYSVQCGLLGIFDLPSPEMMYHYKKKAIGDSDTLIWNINYPVGNNEIDIFERDNKMFQFAYIVRVQHQILYCHSEKTEKEHATHHVS